MTNGLHLKKGQFVRLLKDADPEKIGCVFEVERDNEWSKDLGRWSSVYLKGVYPPRFTHKNNMTLV